MSTSPREARRRTHDRGTRVRLAVLVLVGLLLLAPHVGATRALLTETTVVSTVVSTQEVFPPRPSGEPSPPGELPAEPTGSPSAVPSTAPPTAPPAG